MRPVEAVIRELAQRDVPVLVLAEPGAGKHATAQRIHQMSKRSEQPFRWFQCLGLRPEDLEVLREQAIDGRSRTRARFIWKSWPI